jgi:hypothetical protein
VLDTQPTYLDDAYRSFCVHPQHRVLSAVRVLISALIMLAESRSTADGM